MKILASMLLSMLCLLAGGRGSELTTKTGELLAEGNGQALAAFFRQRCDPKVLERQQLQELRVFLRGFEADAQVKLMAWEALWNARTTMVWRASLVTEVANARDACGTLDAFLSELESIATDPAKGNERARAAAYLAKIHHGLLDVNAAKRWAREAVALGPLDDVDFWQLASDFMTEFQVLDVDFFKRVAAEPSMPGFLRICLLMEIRRHEMIDPIIADWLRDHPDEITDAIPALVARLGTLRDCETLPDQLMKLGGRQGPANTLLLNLARAEALVRRGELEAAWNLTLEVYQSTFELDSGFRFPAFWLDQDAKFRSTETRAQLGLRAAGRRTPIGNHYWRNTFSTRSGFGPGQMRLRCISLLSDLDDDGARLAKLLSNDERFATASSVDRMAQYAAAGLDRLVTDELEACAKNSAGEGAQVRLEILRLATMSRYGHEPTDQIAWRFRFLDASLSLARSLCEQDSSLTPEVVIEVHDLHARFATMRRYVLPTVIELTRNWQPETERDRSVQQQLERYLLSGKPVARGSWSPLDLEAVNSAQPSKIELRPVLDPGERTSLGRRMNDQYVDLGRAEKQKSMVVGRFWWPAGFYSHLENSLRLTEDEIGKLGPQQREFADFARELQTPEGALAVADRLLETPVANSCLDFVAAQHLVREPGGDWAKVSSLASRHIESKIPVERFYAQHLISMVERATGKRAKAAQMRKGLEPVLSRQMDWSAYGPARSPFRRSPGKTEPDRAKDPTQWLTWIVMHKKLDDGDVELAQQVLSTYSEDAEIQSMVRGYQQAMEVLQMEGKLEDFLKTTIASAREGDRIASAVLFTAVVSGFSDMPNREAAELLNRAVPKNSAGHAVMMLECLAAEEEDAALAHWNVAAVMGMPHATAVLLKPGVASDAFFGRICDGVPEVLARCAMTHVNSIQDLAREAFKRGTILEQATRLAIRLRQIRHLPDRRFVGEYAVETPTGKRVAEEMIWPELLRSLGLGGSEEPEPLRQETGEATNVSLLNMGQLDLIKVMFSAANARGELESLYRQARRALDAGVAGLPLHSFCFFAGLEVDRRYTLERVVASGSAERGTSDADLISWHLPLFPQSEERFEILKRIIDSRGKNSSPELLFAAIDLAEELGNAEVASKLFELVAEKAIRSDGSISPTTLMCELTRRGETHHASRLAASMLERSQERPDLVFFNDRHAILDFLEAVEESEPEKVPEMLPSLLELAEKQPGKFDARLWDFAVRHQAAQRAFDLIGRECPEAEPFRDLNTGKIRGAQMFARLVPDAEGKASFEWDLGVTAKGKGFERQRFEIDQFKEWSGNFFIKVRTRRGKQQVDEIAAGPLGRHSLDLNFEDCESVQFELRREGEAPVSSGRFRRGALGYNLMDPWLEELGRDAAAWDPCRREVSLELAVEKSDTGSLTIPLSNPLPLDQFTDIEFDSWIRVDAPSYFPVGAIGGRNCRLGLRLLGEDERPVVDADAIISIPISFETGGGWVFADFRHAMRDSLVSLPAGRYAQLVFTWPIGEKDEGKVRLTLGDPRFSQTRGRDGSALPLPLVRDLIPSGFRAVMTQNVRARGVDRSGVPLVSDRTLALYQNGSLKRLQLPSPPRDVVFLGSRNQLITICEDDSLWRWDGRNPAEPIGELPAASQAGGSLLIASPDGRRLLRLISADGGFVVDTMKLSSTGASLAFSTDLRAHDVVSTPTEIGFASAGAFRLLIGDQWAQVSLLDESVRVFADHKGLGLDLELPRTTLEPDRASGLQVTGLVGFGYRISSFERRGSTKRLWAEAAYFHEASGELVTVEGGWIRRWTPDPDQGK